MIEETVEKEEKKIQYVKKEFPEPSDKVDDLITALVALDGRIKLFDNWIDEKIPVTDVSPQEERLAHLSEKLKDLDCQDIMTKLRDAYKAVDQLPKHVRR